MIANAISVARRRDSRRVGQLATALALSCDHQHTQAGERQRLQAGKPVGEDAQLAQPLKRGDQTLDRRLDRRRPQPLELGHTTAGRDMQKTLEPFALLRAEGGGEHAPAALIGALPCAADESPQRAPPRQQNPAAHQELARAGE